MTAFALGLTSDADPFFLLLLSAANFVSAWGVVASSRSAYAPAEEPSRLRASAGSGKASSVRGSRGVVTASGEGAVAAGRDIGSAVTGDHSSENSSGRENS
ncbi:hypothetical protein GCM10022233_65560 [Streptomyces shaanxiensis]|uniref:Uncharacterized protein n=1 Tax=Streptomyces shaanxiensis TaxID=653357 RepID=A0ABP7VZ43_9ACTN